MRTKMLPWRSRERFLNLGISESAICVAGSRPLVSCLLWLVGVEQSRCCDRRRGHTTASRASKWWCWVLLGLENIVSV